MKLYSSFCKFCENAKRWLDKHKIVYADVNVFLDDKAGKEMVELTGQYGVPVLVFENKTIIGFDEKKYEELIDNSKNYCV